MEALVDCALRIMMSLAQLPTLEPAQVAQILHGVRWQVTRESPIRIDREALAPFPFPAEKLELRWTLETARGFLVVELAPSFRLPGAPLTRALAALAALPATGSFSARTFPHGASPSVLASWDPGRMDTYRAPAGALRLHFARASDRDASGFSIDGHEA